MATTTAFTLRPLERTANSNNLDQTSFRIHLSLKELKNLGLSAGDLIRVNTASKEFCGYAIAWPAQQTNPGNKPIAKISDLLREKYELNLTDSVFLEKVNHSSMPLASIVVRFVQGSDVLDKFSTKELTRCLGKALEDLDIILSGCTFDVHQKGPRYRNRTAKLRAIVESIKPLPDESSSYYYDYDNTQLTITNEQSTKDISAKIDGAFYLNGNGIGGLSDHLRIINEELSFMSLAASMPLDMHLLGSTTFLLHGPEGCGKTLLLERLAESSWRKVFKVDQDWLTSNRKAQAGALSGVFTTARAQQPALVLMDGLDKFMQKAEDLLGCLQLELKKLEGARVVVAATARNVFDIDASLRTPSGLSIELEIFPPNVRQREDILRQALGTDRKLPNVEFTSLAERTHGFVGRDIHKLCSLARHHRMLQVYRTLDTDNKTHLAEIFGDMDFVEQRDFDAVIDQVRPTVLKDSIIEVPKVRWTDIAGVDHVRAELEAITVRPYKYPDLHGKFHVRQSRKGVLLFGPPGCAKTLIAQAVATESNQNFLAVKGSELIKMYVGESERAIRDVFRRARAAKPCIIFFDEIDSIGKSREKTQDSGLNVVTTLLNEMDGIEALKDVFIIGATNRPDILDSALIRKGRFDAHIHIGLPTQEARRQIIEIHTREQPLAEDVDLNNLASRTEGSSGADISGLCAEAVDLAMTDYVNTPGSQPEIRMSHFESALKKHVPHTDRKEAARYEGWQPGRSLSED
ncbi:AAA-domain-containing protein [Lentithecium fluviatile CBS 122367]|uniref:AAA-domain-containing protein n=1 Tax=Lentithecium fluviatile CBS 122367 TaxID=1168545 RepID=A0A6G1JAA5_9PLEO|nr:AAA-domain-containing protein [Lentithecium fluviatile CBS 122367]